MKTPPTATTSGIWAGKPQPPLLAEKQTMMPALTALATSAASALADASSGPFWMLRDQLHEMTVGFNAAAAAKAAVDAGDPPVRAPRGLCRAQGRGERLGQRGFCQGGEGHWQEDADNGGRLTS